MKRKPDEMMEFLIKIAENMNVTGKYFAEARVGSVSGLKFFSAKMKEYENQGDTLVHEANVKLNHAFITQIEQEDIMYLAESMDEVVDGLEECAGYLYMYGLVDEDEYIQKFRENLSKCTDELLTAIKLLAEKKYHDIKPHTVNVKTYEGECDVVERKAIRKLFKKYSDPIRIIQLKDIYELLEDTTDACQAVAKILDSVVMKNL
ncbi:MAG: DUF47 family protein [Lachnospiraceae bacterium]|nr:DUF47 family protein [Lachnospiraceae bacterium]MEE3460874.1 DUF47 family protein [Lachnospiraceae bacterium]